MNDQNIVHQSSGTAALNAEHYQTFEMAKANDSILGGNNIAQIRSYAAYARAQAQAIHKTIAATSTLDDVAAIKAEATETAQTFAKVGIYADQRIGEILRELPKAKGNQYTSADSTVVEKAVTKAEALKDSGISTPMAYQLEQLAANPEVVEAVIAKATEEGRVVSRRQVLDAIKERDDARRELRKAAITQTNLEQTVESLKQQVDAKLKPEVAERDVIPERTKQAIRTLESINKQQRDDYEKLLHRYNEARKELQELSKQVGITASLDNALSELSLFRSKYDGISELAEIFEAIDRVMRG